MVDYKVIGSRIKEQRIKNALTQEQLAELVDITTVYLSKIENGHVRPTIELLSTICSALKCDIGLLLLDSSPMSVNYQNEKVVQLFNACSPKVKPIAIELLEKLSML